MALYKTRQLLANYSQQSVRDLSVSRLEKLYAPVVAQRRQADLDNEQAFEMNIPHIEHVKHLLAQELEQMATEENAHMPITDVFSALQLVKQSKVSENDIGVRALETMLTSMWRKDRTASITSAKFTALNDHFRKNYPRSAVCEVLEKIGESGYMVLEVSKLAALAQDIGSQADYERVILENGLQSNAPHCKKARQFILALVNGDDERPLERTAQEDEGNVIFHGQYVNVSLDTSDPEAPLVFSGNVEVLAEDQPGTFWDAVEDFMGNGGESLNPEDIGALTDAPIIGYDGKAYGFMDYAVKDELEELMNGNKVVFQYGGEYEDSYEGEEDSFIDEDPDEDLV